MIDKLALFSIFLLLMITIIYELCVNDTLDTNNKHNDLYVAQGGLLRGIFFGLLFSGFNMFSAYQKGALYAIMSVLMSTIGY